MGKFLIILGAVFVLVGLILMLEINCPYIGRLPGDIYIKRDNFTFSFPLTTSIIVSIVLDTRTISLEEIV
ncbi:MAG: DUF2905 domain-containing protein [Deltaproteobacteria bacterium]|nr:DUF2905 domain-containing protein [Deltaproteobacteria bacterium]